MNRHHKICIGKGHQDNNHIMKTRVKVRARARVRASGLLTPSMWSRDDLEGQISREREREIHMVNTSRGGSTHRTSLHFRDQMCQQ